MRRSDDSYHHGDLRNALVAAALELLGEHSLAELSLRAVAARAGVSHAAPAHHFRNLKGLLTAVATTGFERFRAVMSEQASQAPSDPASQMRAVTAGYVAFARASPELFKLIFSGPQLDWSDPALKTAASASYAELSRIVAPLVANDLPDRHQRQYRLELLMWSIVHGYSHLLIAGQHDPHRGPDGNHPPMPDIAELLLAESRRRGGEDLLSTI